MKREKKEKIEKWKCNRQRHFELNEIIDDKTLDEKTLKQSMHDIPCQYTWFNNCLHQIEFERSKHEEKMKSK